MVTVVPIKCGCEYYDNEYCTYYTGKFKHVTLLRSANFLCFCRCGDFLLAPQCGEMLFGLFICGIEILDLCECGDRIV